MGVNAETLTAILISGHNKLIIPFIMKKLKNLKNAKVLGKKEQQTIKGGIYHGVYCDETHPCIGGFCVLEANVCLYWRNT